MAWAVATTIAPQRISNDMKDLSVLLCTIDGLTFTLAPEGTGFRWFNPDSSPTAIVGDTLAAARRTMAYRGPELARAYRERTANSVEVALEARQPSNRST
jgi:hypothetical protein